MATASFRWATLLTSRYAVPLQRYLGIQLPTASNMTCLPLLIKSTRSGPYRRLGRWEIQSTESIYPQRIQPRLQINHRRRVRDPLNPSRPKDHQSPDLGYRGAGTIPGHHIRILQRRRRGAACLRHQQAPDIRECDEVAEGAEGPCRCEHRDYVGGEQKRFETSEGCSYRGSQTVCQYEAHLLLPKPALIVDTDWCRREQPIVHRNFGSRRKQR